MRALINNIIENNGNNFFEFYSDQNNSVSHLREQSFNAPNRPGLYLVFSKSRPTQHAVHLKYKVATEDCELIYIGKAGGYKNGKLIKQGLNGRINNVISDSSRQLKDIKRGAYWDLVMNEYQFEKFVIVYFEHPNPKELENLIYNYLDEGNHIYPLLNKKRGRKKSLLNKTRSKKLKFKIVQ